MAPRVVVTDHTFGDLDLEASVLSSVDVELVDATARAEPLGDLVAGAVGLIVMYEEIDAALMDRMPDCRVISRMGIGVDNVDVEAATERGIAVTNVPDYCIDEVSDHTLALMLALQRKLVAYDDQTSEGGWNVSAGRPMHRLSEQTIGLVAFGKTARQVCRKATAFGMDVLAWDPYLDPDEIEAAGATPIDELTDLLGGADVVSVHPPLTPETRGLIAEDEFDQMPSTAFVLNVARGGIVDEGALASALDDGAIAGAGIDVLTEEPPEDSHPLVGRDDVLLTPHAAWNSVESVRELRTKAAENARGALAGERPEYLVNEDLPSA